VCGVLVREFRLRQGLQIQPFFIGWYGALSVPGDYMFPHVIAPMAMAGLGYRLKKMLRAAQHRTLSPAEP
jgi:hypothetical protein